MAQCNVEFNLWGHSHYKIACVPVHHALHSLVRARNYGLEHKLTISDPSRFALRKCSHSFRSISDSFRSISVRIRAFTFRSHLTYINLSVNSPFLNVISINLQVFITNPQFSLAIAGVIITIR